MRACRSLHLFEAWCNIFCINRFQARDLLLHRHSPCLELVAWSACCSFGRHGVTLFLDATDHGQLLLALEQLAKLLCVLFLVIMLPLLAHRLEHYLFIEARVVRAELGWERSHPIDLRGLPPVHYTHIVGVPERSLCFSGILNHRNLLFNDLITDLLAPSCADDERFYRRILDLHQIALI